MQIRAITWNLFHGRDAPPDRSLGTWRSRLLRVTEQNETHLQVNRNLLPEFSAMLDGFEWDVALLQECRPRWAGPLGAATESGYQRVLTSRNSFPWLRNACTALSPDLIASGEGGSNVILVRRKSGAGEITERRELILQPRRPERRMMAYCETGSGLCVANVHTTNDSPGLSIPELRAAAKTASAWAGGRPLIFGGDLNLRPAEHPEIFEELEVQYSFAAPTGPHSIDHLLVRGIEVTGPPHALPAERREVTERGRAIRLSDHAPVILTGEMPDALR